VNFPMKNIITILTALLLSQSISLAKDCFPGQAVSYSPAKHYSIIWQEPSNGETHHLIFSNGTERKLFFDFGREVCIHWESQEKYFALTYYAGSNVSEVYIYSPDEPRKLFDLVDFIPTQVKKLYAENYHSYIEVLDWTDTGLLARVWGYGDRSPKGFEVRLRCTTKDKFSCTEEKANKALKRGAAGVFSK